MNSVSSSVNHCMIRESLPGVPGQSLPFFRCLPRSARGSQEYEGLFLDVGCMTQLCIFVTPYFGPSVTLLHHLDSLSLILGIEMVGWFDNGEWQ